MAIAETVADKYTALVRELDKAYVERRGAVKKARAAYDKSFADISAQFGKALAAEYAPHVTQVHQDALFSEAVERSHSPYGLFAIQEHYRYLADKFYPQS